MPTCSGQHHIKQLITTPYHKYNYIIYSRFFQLFCGILTVIIPVCQKSFLQQKAALADGSCVLFRTDHIRPYIIFCGRIISNPTFIFAGGSYPLYMLYQSSIINVSNGARIASFTPASVFTLAFCSLSELLIITSCLPSG